MKIIRLVSLVVLVALVISVLNIAYTVRAEPAAHNYAIDWWTVDGGGGQLSGAGYTLTGTVGQPDADELAGNGYGLGGGFWAKLVESTLKVFMPLVLR